MKIIRFLAIMTIVAGLIGWIITFSVNPDTSPFSTAYQITFIANPIGVILSLILFRKGVHYGLLLLLLNLFLIISFGPIWFLTDLFHMSTGK